MKRREKNIPTIDRFFSENLAQELKGTYPKADLLIGNNVLAHVPELNDFVTGMKIILNTNGVITMEFLTCGNSYLRINSILSTMTFQLFFISYSESSFQRAWTKIFDVDELPTHGAHYEYMLAILKMIERSIKESKIYYNSKLVRA